MMEAISTLLIGSVILGFAFNGFFSMRQIFISDKAKVDANQRLRTIFTTIGPDIQQTGEGLISDPKLPAIEISEQNIGSTTVKTSEIIVRKAVVPSSLNVCQSITAGTTSIVNVIDNISTDTTCRVNDFQPEDGWPDTVKIWQGLRQNKGGSIRAYIYDGNGNGEFFNYTGEETKDSGGTAMTPAAGTKPEKVNITTGGHTWLRDYPFGSFIYLMEERRFRVQDEKLQLIVNNSETFDITEDVEKLEIKAILQKEAGGTQYVCKKIPPTVTTDCSPNFPDPATEYSWAQIKTIDVTAKILPGENTNNQSTGTLTQEDLSLTQQFFPRNRLSF
ncbi:hypothetical protein GM3709_1331 [Geminocystis sp. NIES-3709]|nr:hypothetical protein GM3709_1331 [Geminocystis sp. NIES-3709]